MFKWIESRFSIKYLIFSAVFCGLALGTKYNGLIVLFLLTLFVAYVRSRHTGDKETGFVNAAGSGMLFCLLALLIFSPWMIRNYHWTGNPVFPLYDAWFNPQSGISHHDMDLFTLRRLIFNESWWQMALLPVRVFFEGQDGSPQYFDGKLNSFLLFLPFLAFFKFKNDSTEIKTEKKILLAFSVLYFSFAFFGTNLRIRYLSPIIPPLVILSVYGLKNLFNTVGEANSKKMQRVLIICVSGIGQFREIEPFSFLTGGVSRDEYIEKFRPEYAAMRYINENLPLDAKILFIHLGNRGFYCDRRYLFDMQRGVSTLHQIVKNSSFPQKVVLELKRRKITHFLIRNDLFKFWVKNNYDSREIAILDQIFIKYVKMIYFRKGYGVYQL